MVQTSSNLRVDLPRIVLSEIVNIAIFSSLFLARTADIVDWPRLGLCWAWSVLLSEKQVCQSNLGRGPRRCKIKSPLVTMARPKFAPKSTPSRGAIPKPQNVPHPWARLTYDAKQHPDPIRRFSTMHCSAQTDTPTDRSSTGKFDVYRPLRSESDAA